MSEEMTITEALAHPLSHEIKHGRLGLYWFNYKVDQIISNIFFNKQKESDITMAAKSKAPASKGKPTKGPTKPAGKKGK
jgi:hypothetical protein